MGDFRFLALAAVTVVTAGSFKGALQFMYFPAKGVDFASKVAVVTAPVAMSRFVVMIRVVLLCVA